MTDTYRGWTISYDPPPIPIRSFDWQAYGPNYDAWTEGEGDWTDNGEKAAAPTREELVGEIDAWFEENAASVDGRRMAEPVPVSGRSPTSAVPEGETPQ